MLAMPASLLQEFPSSTDRDVHGRLAGGGACIMGMVVLTPVRVFWVQVDHLAAHRAAESPPEIMYQLSADLVGRLAEQ